MVVGDKFPEGLPVEGSIQEPTGVGKDTETVGKTEDVANRLLSPSTTYTGSRPGLSSESSPLSAFSESAAAPKLSWMEKKKAKLKALGGGNQDTIKEAAPKLVFSDECRFALNRVSDSTWANEERKGELREKIVARTNALSEVDVQFVDGSEAADYQAFLMEQLVDSGMIDGDGVLPEDISLADIGKGFTGSKFVKVKGVNVAVFKCNVVNDQIFNHFKNSIFEEILEKFETKLSEHVKGLGLDSGNCTRKELADALDSGMETLIGSDDFIDEAILKGAETSCKGGIAPSDLLVRERYAAVAAEGEGVPATVLLKMQVPGISEHPQLFSMQKFVPEKKGKDRETIEDKSQRIRDINLQSFQTAFFTHVGMINIDGHSGNSHSDENNDLVLFDNGLILPENASLRSSLMTCLIDYPQADEPLSPRTLNDLRSKEVSWSEKKEKLLGEVFGGRNYEELNERARRMMDTDCVMTHCLGYLCQSGDADRMSSRIALTKLTNLEIGLENMTGKSSIVSSVKELAQREDKSVEDFCRENLATVVSNALA